MQLAGRQTDRQTDKQTNRQTWQVIFIRQFFKGASMNLNYGLKVLVAAATAEFTHQIFSSLNYKTLHLDVVS